MHDRGRQRIEDNPFYVLGLATSATRVEVEREGQKLLGMLELGLASARSYATPLGPVSRTPEKVRGAMAELRDPERRLVHELWTLPAGAPVGGASPVSASDMPAPTADAPPAPGRWRDAMASLGFGDRRR